MIKKLLLTGVFILGLTNTCCAMDKDAHTDLKKFLTDFRHKSCRYGLSTRAIHKLSAPKININYLKLVISMFAELLTTPISTGITRGCSKTRTTYIQPYTAEQLKRATKNNCIPALFMIEHLLLLVVEHAPEKFSLFFYELLPAWNYNIECLDKIEDTALTEDFVSRLLSIIDKLPVALDKEALSQQVRYNVVFKNPFLIFHTYRSDQTKLVWCGR